MRNRLDELKDLRNAIGVQPCSCGESRCEDNSGRVDPRGKGGQGDKGFAGNYASHAWILPLRREWNRSGSTERESQPRQDREVGVKLDALKPANAEPVQPVVVLQASELPLNSAATPVQIAEPFGVAWDARKEPTADSWSAYPALLHPRAGYATIVTTLPACFSAQSAGCGATRGNRGGTHESC
jgi:hypothetical protein